MARRLPWDTAGMGLPPPTNQNPSVIGRAQRALKRLLLTTVALLLLGVTGTFFGLRYLALTPVDAQDTALQEVMVRQGVTLREMGRRLEKGGLIHSATAWRVSLLINPPAPIKAGRHLVGKGMDVPHLADTLAGKPLS